MVRYDYHCRGCGIGFEVERSFSMPASSEACPECSSGNTVKQIPKLNLNLSSTVAEPSQPMASCQPAPQSKLRKSQVYMTDVTIENCGGGIRAENTRIEGKRVTIRNCERGIVGRNADLDIDDLKIT